MSGGNPLRGMVPFPLFDGTRDFPEPTGYVLRFTNGESIQLKQKYAPDGKRVIVNVMTDVDPVTGNARDRLDWISYKEVVRAAVAGGDDEVILDCLKHGIKNADGDTKPVIVQKVWNDLPFATADVQPVILEALFLAWYGKSMSQIAEEAKEVETAIKKAMQESEEPTLDRPTVSSNGSSTPPLGQDKAQTLSGD